MKPITPEDIQKACDQLALTLIQKNHDYGNSVQEQYKEYGITSFNIRLDDKLRRSKQLSTLPPKVVGESLKDTFLDGAGYNVLAYICLALEEESKGMEVLPFTFDKKPPYADLDD